MDLQRIPEHTIERRTGFDSKEHYYCEYEVEVTHYSASTRYELVYKGVRFGAVTAEYV